MTDFWDVVERCHEGERINESDYDALLWKNVSELIEKYDLQFDEGCIIPDDDSLADRAYEAGVELFLRMGLSPRGRASTQDRPARGTFDYLAKAL